MQCTECPECRYWFGLSTLPGLGRTRTRKLVDRFGSAGGAWRAQESEWRTIKGFGPQVTAAALAERSDDRLDRAIGALQARSIELLCPDNLFPPQLKHIHDPPQLLYAQGTLKPCDARAVAIVGSRKPSAHAVEMAGALAASLASIGITIVSGLAAGIDAAAHKGALEAGGRTIAVMGSGMDRIYPPSHAKLAAQIARQGALVTEYPLGSEPNASHFPMRNRLIAGWALAVVVVEAPERSGALITAFLALDQHRDVLAVPGDAGRASCLGSNRLLQEGAGVALSAADVVSEIRLELEAAGWRPPDPATFEALTRGERAVRRSDDPPDATSGTAAAVTGISVTPGSPTASSTGGTTALGASLLALVEQGGERRVEGLVAESGHSAAEVQRALFSLEMAGLIRATPTGEYVRSGTRSSAPAG